MSMTVAAPASPAVPTVKTIGMRILRASSVYGLANLGLRALNFLLLPLYTRYLSPSDYGTIALAETLAAFFASVISMGFDAAIQRLYFRHVGESGRVSEYLSSVFKFGLGVQALFVALVLTVGPGLQHLVAPASPIPYRYFALAMITAVATQFFNYRLVVCQAEHRPWMYAVLSFTSFVATASLCIALVVFARRGALGMLTGKLIAAGICFSLALFLARHLFRAAFHWSFVRETIAVGLPLVPHLLMALGLVTADRFILAHYRDLREVGLYSTAYTLGMIMSLITMSLNQAWAPLYYETAKNGEQGRRILGRTCNQLILALTAVACIGVLIAQDFISHFLDRRYAPAGRVVPWIIAAYLAHSLFSMFTLACMQARRTKLIMVASFVGLLINTVLNFALIPRWGMYGAAYATLIGYVLEAAVMYSFAQKFYKLDYELGRATIGLGVFCAALSITQVHLNQYRGLTMIGVALLALLALAGLGLSGRRDVPSAPGAI